MDTWTDELFCKIFIVENGELHEEWFWNICRTKPSCSKPKRSWRRPSPMLQLQQCQLLPLTSPSSELNKTDSRKDYKKPSIRVGMLETRLKKLQEYSVYLSRPLREVCGASRTRTLMFEFRDRLNKFIWLLLSSPICKELSSEFHTFLQLP